MPVPSRRIEAVRAFNRFYTRAIGVLGDGHLDSDLTLTEVRVLYEVAQRAGVSASEIGHAVGVDPGYLSRILAGFARRGLVTRRESDSDRRRSVLALSGRGKAKFAELDRRASLDVGALLGKLDEDAQSRVVEAMATVRTALDPTPGSPSKPTLRAVGPGDLGPGGRATRGSLRARIRLGRPLRGTGCARRRRLRRWLRCSSRTSVDRRVRWGVRWLRFPRQRRRQRRQAAIAAGRAERPGKGAR